ncbi:hypothetical protein [Streptomyces sp. NPDC002265]|uniref:hypothetical protein n=1 Tax=Streptomyces sp. NPDC002265 TaxID=3154415 RepID=UPI0033253922
MWSKADQGWADGDTAAAAAAGAAQLSAAFVVWLVHLATLDDHGAGYGGAFGLACLLLFAPLWLPVVGLLHTYVQTRPAAALADLVPCGGRRSRWLRHLLCAALLGVLWAAAAALLWDWPFGATALVSAGLGVLPVLAVAHARRRARTGARAWGTWDLWWRAGAASVALFVLAVAGGAGATGTGLVRTYEPPSLSADRLAGVWRGEDGAVLRLRPDGRAGLSRVPAQPVFGTADDFTVCDGTGTWAFETDREEDGRDAVVVRLGGGCGQETSWTVGGTARSPELFVLLGDPDAGELRILKRSS